MSLTFIKLSPGGNLAYSVYHSGSVSKVAGSGEDHGEAEAVGGLDGVLVADGASGLGYGDDSALGGHFDAVGEWEEGIGGED